MSSTTTDYQKNQPGKQGALERQTDEQLLVGYRESGQKELFAELVQRYERELFSYLRRYLGSAEMAEDVFQAAFLQVHLKCEQFEQGRSFRPWLYTIATNQAIDAQRRNRRHRMVSLDRAGSGSEDDNPARLANLLVNTEPGPLAELTAAERRETVRAAVSQLPEGLRKVVTLVYYQGLKYREAAVVLGIPVGTVKSRLHAAILKLNKAWQETTGQQK